MIETTILTFCYKEAIFENKNTLYKYIGNRGFENMRKIVKKLSAIALCTVFASMQVSASIMTGDTGLGAGNGGAVINNYSGGYVGTDLGSNSATLKFEGNSHVNWDTLNVNKGESLNFNAVNGATGLTVVNTVNKGMTNVYGQISSNQGIAKLIISNPNGMLFDGATFTTAGDLQLTTQALAVNYLNGNLDIKGLEQEAVNGIVIKGSDFNIGGQFNVVAPSVEIIGGYIGATKGLRLVTKDGQDYLLCPKTSEDAYHDAVRLETVEIDGDVYILSGKDIVKVVNGGEIDGNLVINSDGNLALNYVDGGKTFNVKGDLTAENDARKAFLRNSKVDGNVNMSNSGGDLEIANVTVGGNVDLKTTVKTNEEVKHFVHVVGDNDIKGNLNIDSIHNIHIGGYDQGLENINQGSLKVGGDLNAYAREGSIAMTVDTVAKNAKLTSGTLNIISDGKATLTADNYEFDAKYYIGGINDDQVIIDTMEGYVPITDLTKTTYFNTQGGNVNKIKTDENGIAKVRGNDSMIVNGVNSGFVHLSSGKDIKIGPDAKAHTITVDGETRNLTVELPKRDYTLKYTNIKDTEVITVNPDKTITYDMANGENGWNKGTQTAQNTYLVVPGEPQPEVPPVIEPDPVDPVDPVVDPEDPTKDEAEKILRNLNRDEVASAIDAQQVYTPVAFAADLDDEIDTGVRKNVDGSVTVVRPYTPSK